MTEHVDGVTIDLTSGDPESTAEDTNEPATEADATDEEVEPVELLVQLAEDEEIDPWNIDLVAVTDKFLGALDSADLRAGGRALFYASVLLRMKSEALTEASEPEESADIEEEHQWIEPTATEAPGTAPENGRDPFDALEQEMDRRLDRKRARGTPQTLDELVRELRERERNTHWKESRTYDTSDSPRGFSRGTQTLDYRDDDARRMDEEPSETEVTGTTHTEDIETTIQTVYRALCEQYDRGRDAVLYAEINAVGGSRVETFLALLFLGHRGQVRLEQDELFGDLWIHDQTAGSTADEAVAD
ncbi:segregation and condensation protein A [Halocatena pleomorpha]|uniref:Segregation/condensation protein A n=1 Tax=Halocatena pleomorpha TaxID=1785090 RepID=A0A3P3R3Z0_9EURY|nr:ScpA family protein [Halocatena pleomorpha]RRJ28044.1 segregation/condensation protein A [Halocatena pleomorpha]